MKRKRRKSVVVTVSPLTKSIHDEKVKEIKRIAKAYEKELKKKYGK